MKWSSANLSARDQEKRDIWMRMMEALAGCPNAGNAKLNVQYADGVVKAYEERVHGQERGGAVTPKLKTPGGIVIDADKLHEWALEYERDIEAYNDAKDNFDRALLAAARAAKALLAAANKEPKIPWQLIPEDRRSNWQTNECVRYRARAIADYLPKEERDDD